MNQATDGELSPEFREMLREEKKETELALKALPLLIAGDGWSIIQSYAQEVKATLLADLANKTTQQLMDEGKSHDSISGQIKGIVCILNAPEILLQYAEETKSTVEENEDA